MGDSDNSPFPERKVEDFYFKQLKKLQIFDSPEGLPLARSHLLAVSNKYGLCFVGCPTGVKIFRTDIIGKISKADERNINAVVSEYPSIYINIGEAVRHVGISCDNVTLSVCYEKGNNIVFRVYDIPTIYSQTGSQMLGEVALSTDAGSSLVNLLWNPLIPNMFAACFSNGSVTMWEMTDTKITKTGYLPVSTRATAICWSPKGKQIVVGHKDGHLTQYTPNLEVKKETPIPEIFKDSPRQVTSICWISAGVFLNVYTTEKEGDFPQCVLVCNGTKASPMKQTINFDDVYFGTNEDREKGFYTTHLSEWNVTMSVSCNAFEVAVFGNEQNWEKWTFEDEKRAAMPLNKDNDETYPMGIAIDLTSTIPIVENENSYPPAPLLLLLSTDGVLCPFYMVNKNPKARHDIVTPAEPLPPPGPRSKIVGDAPLQSKAQEQQGGQKQPFFQLPKTQEQQGGQKQPVFQLPTTAPTLLNTGTTQPSTKPNFFSSSSSSSPFSFRPSSSSQPTADSTSTKPFNFTTPSNLGFNATPVKPVTTESKTVLPDAAIPSTKPLFLSPGLFTKKSDSTLPPGSEFHKSGFPTGIPSCFAPSTGPPENPTSQLPTSKSSFPNLFSSQQPQQPGLDKPGSGTQILKPTPTTEPMSAPKETDALKGTITSGLTLRPLELEREKQQQIKKQQEAYLQQQQQQREQELQQQLQQRQQEDRDALKSTITSGFNLRPLELEREKQQQIKKQQEAYLQQQQQQREQEPQQQQQLQQRQQEQELYQQQRQLQQRQQQQEQQQQLQQRQLELQQRQQQQERQQQERQQQERQQQERQQQERQQQERQQQERQQQERQQQERQQQERQQQERQQQERQQQERQQQRQQRQREQQQLEQQRERQQQMTQQNLELSVSKCIFEEIQLFNNELKKLTKDVQKVKNVCSEFEQAKELERLRVDTEHEAKKCDELKQVAKDHHGEIQDTKKKLLSSFEILEDARVRHHRAKDRRFLHLLKSRDLDPMNANKMRTIRDLYMHLDKTIGEVNLVLDEEWNKEKENKNKIQRPTMDAVYRTLQAHQRIAEDQSVRLDKIADKMKRKNLISLSWNKASASIVSSRENMNELSSLSGSMKSLDLETTTRSSFKAPDTIPANKSAQLINMLRKRQTTPIRRSTVVSPDTSRARQIQRRLAQPITNLSPPSRQERIVAETPSVKSTSATHPLFSSTPAVTSGPGEAFAFEENGAGKFMESVRNEENPSQTSRGTYNPLFPSSTAVTSGPGEAFVFQENGAGKFMESVRNEENPSQTSRGTYNPLFPSSTAVTSGPGEAFVFQENGAGMVRESVRNEWNASQTSRGTYNPLFPSSTAVTSELEKDLVFKENGAGMVRESVRNEENASQINRQSPSLFTSFSSTSTSQTTSPSSGFGAPHQTLGTLGTPPLSAATTMAPPPQMTAPKQLFNKTENASQTSRQSPSLFTSFSSTSTSQTTGPSLGFGAPNQTLGTLGTPPLSAATTMAPPPQMTAPKQLFNKTENASQTSRQSPSLFTSFSSTSTSQTTGPSLGFGAPNQTLGTLGTPPLSTATTGAPPPQMTVPKQLFNKTGLSSQQTEQSGSTDSPLARSTGTPPLSTGFNMPLPSSEKNMGDLPSSFSSTSTGTTAKETPFKFPSADPGEKTTVLKQLLQQTPGSSPRTQTVTPAALAAMSRAVEMRAENTNLDPSASIEPRSMVTHGQSGAERTRDIKKENIAAKSIADEALKYSQLEAKNAGAKPQSSTEFAIKDTENPKPGPPVVVEMRAENTNLDPSASIEPRSMVTHGQSGAERTRDIKKENIAAKSIADEALKYSQLEAKNAGAKPQSSTEFAIKDTENPKPGPPVVVEMRAENTNLDPSASIEPRSMVTHGQSGAERTRDIKKENIAAKSIADEALKYSQLEAKNAGAKPQSSTEFAIKDTKNPKPGPPVVTVKPVSSKDKTVKPVPVAATSLTRPSIVPLVNMPSTQTFSKTEMPSFSVPDPSSGTTYGFSLGTAKDIVPLKENIGTAPKPISFSFAALQNTKKETETIPPSSLGSESSIHSFKDNIGTATKPISFSFVAPQNTKKETETIPPSSLGSESSIQPKSSPLNSGIVKPNVLPSPGVSRQLFKDTSNQIKDTNDQKEQAEGSRDLQKSGTPVTTGTSLGFQLSSDKENVAFGATTLTSLPSKPDEGASSLGFKLASPKIGTPSFAAVPGKETTTSDSSSGVKPFSFGSSVVGAGLTFGQTSTTAPFRPFANIQTALSTSPTSSFGSTISSSSGFITPGSFSFSSKEPSMTPATSSSGGVSSGFGTSGLFTLTPKTTAASSTTVTSVTSSDAATSAGVTASPFSNFMSSAKGTSQGEILGSTTATMTATTSQGVTTQVGLFAPTTTTSQGGTPQVGLFAPTTTTSQGGTPQVGLFAATTTTSQGGTPQVGLFAATTTTSQGGTPQVGLFAPTSTTSQGETPQVGLFAPTSTTSQGETPQVGLFAATTTTSQGGTPQVGLFAPTTTISQGGTPQVGLFAATTTTSQGETPQVGLFAPTTTTSQGGTPQVGLFAPTTPLFDALTTSQSGTSHFGSPSSSTSSAFGQPSFGQAAFAQSPSNVTSSTSSAFCQSAFSKPQETASTGTGLSFGGLGLGGQPSQLANKNPFLTSATSSPSNGSSLFGTSDSTGLKPAFGSGSPSSFGSQSSGSFGGGSFSKGTGNVASSGFSLGGGGSSGFGSLPAFGSAPAFGSSSSFGSSNAAFGSAPVFGSSPQIGMPSTGSSFGSSTGSGSFGNVSGSPTFGALAHQSTVPSFGNVAQQAQQGQTGFGGFAQQSTGFGGFGSPGGDAGANPAFGGSPSQSFNQWR